VECQHQAFRCKDECRNHFNPPKKDEPVEVADAEISDQVKEEVSVSGQAKDGNEEEEGEEQEQDKHACPPGTFVYHSGSHCCKENEDRDGRPLRYDSLTCSGNSYVECPAGAVEGSCKRGNT
jgi:hypothetical protein